MNRLEDIFKELEKMPIAELKSRIARAEEIIADRVYNDDFEICIEIPEIKSAKYKYEK